MVCCWQGVHTELLQEARRPSGCKLALLIGFIFFTIKQVQLHEDLIRSKVPFRNLSMAFFGVAFFVGGITLGVYYFSATSVAVPQFYVAFPSR